MLTSAADSIVLALRLLAEIYLLAAHRATWQVQSCASSRILANSTRFPVTDISMYSKGMAVSNVSWSAIIDRLVSHGIARACRSLPHR